MMTIENAVAVITGGSGGIGKELARYWLSQGGKVVLADIGADALQTAKTDLGDTNVAVFAMDVTKEEDCSRLADFTVQTWGQINLVAPFAGIIRDGMMVAPDRETGKVTGKMALRDFQSVLDVNVTGVFLTVRECVERMVNGGFRGLVCLISSTSSLGTAGQLNYASSKASMSVMPKVLTAEFFRRGLAGRIRCVAVAPGYVGTPMVASMNQKALARIIDEVPVGRLIEPSEVASLVGELYRNEALAGEVFYISGGLRLGSRG